MVHVARVLADIWHAREALEAFCNRHPFHRDCGILYVPNPCPGAEWCDSDGRWKELAKGCPSASARRSWRRWAGDLARALPESAVVIRDEERPASPWF